MIRCTIVIIVILTSIQGLTQKKIRCCCIEEALKDPFNPGRPSDIFLTDSCDDNKIKFRWSMMVGPFDYHQDENGGITIRLFVTDVNNTRKVDSIEVGSLFIPDTTNGYCILNSNQIAIENYYDVDSVRRNAKEISKSKFLFGIGAEGDESKNSKLSSHLILTLKAIALMALNGDKRAISDFNKITKKIIRLNVVNPQLQEAMYELNLLLFNFDKVPKSDIFR